MHCPVCNYSETKVTDTRVSGDGLAIRRRRECLKCSFRFSTVEEHEILDLTVVKRNGERRPYDRDKLANGLRKSLEKRPVTTDRFKKLLGSIEVDIQRKKKNEITTREIGEIVMKRLMHFDKVAYIRFASVYRQFEDVGRFQHEVKKLLTARKKRRK